MGCQKRPLVFLPRRNTRNLKKRGSARSRERWSFAPAIFRSLGIEPRPCYEEPPRSPVSTPELAKEYPLVLISGSRVKPYVHSCYRQIESLRRTHRDPYLAIHPETAGRLGIADSDWVHVETPEAGSDRGPNSPGTWIPGLFMRTGTGGFRRRQEKRPGFLMSGSRTSTPSFLMDRSIVITPGIIISGGCSAGYIRRRTNVLSQDSCN